MATSARSPRGVTFSPSKLRRAREQRHMTQSDLVRAVAAIEHAPHRRRYRAEIVSRYELGIQIPSLARIGALAEALGMPLHRLLDTTAE